MRGARALVLPLLLGAAVVPSRVAGQQDPPRQDCCAHLYNTAINLGWASSLLNHVLVPGIPDTGARGAVIADLLRAADHITAARRACSEWNPVWPGSPDLEQRLRQQAGRLQGRGAAGRDLAVQARVRETYRWGEELSVGAVGMPTQRVALPTPNCDQGYFRLGWLFGYATQTFRMARAFRDQGRPDWTAVLEDGRAYLRTAIPVLDQYQLSPNHANIDLANPYGRLSRMLAAPAALVDSMERDMDELWTLAQQAIASDCAVLPGRLDAPPTPGYCVLRRPDLYQPNPGPPRCFEFYLADANVQDASRMASIGPGGCGATYFAWRQGWRPDPSYGGPFRTWREGDQAMTILSRYGQDFYGCLQGADSAPRPPGRPPREEPPPSQPRGEPPRAGLIVVSGGLDQAVVAQKVASYDRNNFDASFEATPVSLEIEPDVGRATINSRIVFHMMSFNRGIQVRDEVEFTYTPQPGTGSATEASGETAFTAVMKSNGRVTREWSGTLTWRAERQADGSWRFHLENGIGGWYAPIPWVLGG